MSRAIVIHCSRHVLQAVVAHGGRVEAIVDVPVEGEVDIAEIGRRLATALSPHAPARAEVLVAVGRSALDWQHLTLPPCPADDLADLVMMQVVPDGGATGDAAGFDFLPLTGDESTSHHLLAITLSTAEQDRLQTLCRAANLKPSRIVPLAVGWPACGALFGQDSAAGTTVFVAPFAEEPCIWATIDDRVVLFRQLRLATPDDSTMLESAVAAELRRTRLALSQQLPQHDVKSIQVIGAEQERLAGLSRSISEELGIDVQSVTPAKQFSPRDGSDLTSTLLPLAGLALDESSGRQPLVDLRHPRRRPAPRSRRMAYLLAAGVAATLAGLLIWRGYVALQAPLVATAAAEEELAQISKTLDDFRDDEQQHDALDKWNSNSLNVLLALDELSSLLRTEALDAASFPEDQDTVVKRLDIAGRQITVVGHARSSEIVQQLESRLRQKVERVQRATSEPSDDVPGYPWHYELIVDLTSTDDDAEGDDAEGKAP